MNPLNPLRALRFFIEAISGRRNFLNLTASEKGRLGEREAERHLKKKGFRIVKRNWRKGHDEIDLICRDQETLVFVEVRTRKDKALVSGYHSVTPKKKRALLRVCKGYLRSRRKYVQHYRFDLVEVRWLEDGKVACLHYENVALFPNRSH
ncbi:MAG: endonuclease [Opitutaceae bacterium]|nr:endonuclease [Opitutaceae bacterium]